MRRLNRGLPFMAGALLVAALAGCGGQDDGGSTVASETTTTTTLGDATRAAAIPAAGVAKTHNLSAPDSGKTVKANIGDRVRITLDECASCGYHWEQTKTPDGKVLKADGNRSVSTTPSSDGDGAPIVGGSQLRVFTYSVVGQGTTSATLGYFPPADETPEEMFVLKVDASTAAGTSVGPKTYNFDESDSGRSVTIARGDKVYVSLYVCGPCGESMDVTKKPDSKILREDPSANDSTTTTTADPDGPLIVGGGSDYIFGWDAVGTGKTTIEIDWTPAGDDEPSGEPFTLTITVSAI